jgi:hypothetical protein
MNTAQLTWIPTNGRYAKVLTTQMSASSSSACACCQFQLTAAFRPANGRQSEQRNARSRGSLIVRKIGAVGIGLGLTGIGPGAFPAMTCAAERAADDAFAERFAWECRPWSIAVPLEQQIGGDFRSVPFRHELREL